VDADGLIDLAITDNGMIAITAKASSDSWINIPDGLYNKLWGRQASLPRPKHVALGPDDQYFVLFSDGSWEGIAPDDFFEAVRGSGNKVTRVTLGPWGQWVVLYKDGTQAWGADLPDGLYNQLNSRNPRLSKPTSVSIGPDGEWFVAFADGKWKAGGLWDDLEAALNECRAEGTIRHVLFGTHIGYLIALD
jgi:hypothetical protein